MFKRLLEPHPDKRPAITEVNKYLKDQWFVDGSKGPSHGPSPSSSAHAIFAGTPSTGPYGRGAARGVQFPPTPTSGPVYERVDPAKGRLRNILSSYGLETRVDQQDLSRRIWDWVSTESGMPVSYTVRKTYNKYYYLHIVSYYPARKLNPPHAISIEGGTMVLYPIQYNLII